VLERPEAGVVVERARRPGAGQRGLDPAAQDLAAQRAGGVVGGEGGRDA